MTQTKQATAAAAPPISPAREGGKGDPSLPRGLRIAVFTAAAVFCLTPWASPPIALILGAVLAIALENPLPQISRKWSKTLLQASVVMLGFGMNLSIVLRAGAEGAAFAAATIFATLLLGYLVGKWLKLSAKTTALISAGTAICGGSAIAAVGSAIDAEEGDMTVAIGTVFLLNALALFVFPPLGAQLGLSQRQFGTWAGVAIHDVSSVVGAAKTYVSMRPAASGEADALQVATAVKLSRALWIIPLTLAIAFVFSRSDSRSGAQGLKRKSLPIPYFIGLFLLASVLRSFVPAVASIAPTLTAIAKIGFTLTLFLIGAGLSMKTLRAVGWKAVVLGVSLWVMISVTSLLVITRTV